VKPESGKPCTSTAVGHCAEASAGETFGAGVDVSTARRSEAASARSSFLLADGTRVSVISFSRLEIPDDHASARSRSHVES
jgi:hypothetical protein